MNVNEYYAIMAGGASKENLWAMPVYNQGSKPITGINRPPVKKTVHFKAPAYNNSTGKPILHDKRKGIANSVINWNKSDDFVASIDNDRNIALNHSFRVDIPQIGLIAGNFSKVTGLESELTLESYREGGDNGKEHYFPSYYSQSRVVLERALVTGDPLDIWAGKMIALGMIIKLPMVITLLQGFIPVAMWAFADTYPVKTTGPDFDSLSAAPAVTRVEMIHNGIERLY